jgi:SAM-dependent methyltransferase
MQDFYRAFEDRHRGSRDLIKSRLAFYRPFVETLLSAGSLAHGLDLGCGRGEWLESLKSWGLDARGVDTDPGMLDGCRGLGLNVKREDLFAELGATPENSLDLVTAFHVVEHIDINRLSRLMSELVRVLKPGGLLILETPNPENLVVATNSFYLDPTHLRPVPPMLLSFVAEHAGCVNTTIVRLQESKELASKPIPNLNEVLHGASPDYAVIAQKPGDADREQRFSQQTALPIGLSLSDLAARASAGLERKLDAITTIQLSVSSLQIEALELRRLQSESEARVRDGLERLHNALVARMGATEASLQAAQGDLAFAHQKIERALQQSHRANLTLNTMSTSPFWLLRLFPRWIRNRFRAATGAAPAHEESGIANGLPTPGLPTPTHPDQTLAENAPLPSRPADLSERAQAIYGRLKERTDSGEVH